MEFALAQSKDNLMNPRCTVQYTEQESLLHTGQAQHLLMPKMAFQILSPFNSYMSRQLAMLSFLLSCCPHNPVKYVRLRVIDKVMVRAKEGFEPGSVQLSNHCTILALCRLPNARHLYMKEGYTMTYKMLTNIYCNQKQANFVLVLE